MRQLKVSFDFAVVTIVVIASFFSWMIWLTARAIYVGEDLVNTTYAQYELTDGAADVEKKSSKIVTCPVPNDNGLVKMSESECKKLLQ